MKHDIRNWINQNIWQPFAGVDLRSLALFRVVIACAMLLSIYFYWPDAETFFLDKTGLFPRSEAIARSPHYYWSVLYMSSAPWFLHAFFALYTLSALALLFGYKTRLATVLCWVCSVSMRVSGSIFISLADVQLCILLFWGMFLPLGARFSIDAALKTQFRPSNHYASVASLALILNVAYLYVMGALEKTGDPWVKDLHAVYYSITNIETTTPLAPYVAQFGDKLTYLTYAIYHVELLAVIFLFLPKYTQLGRMVAVPQLILLHIGFMLLLSIGIFPLVSISGLCALLPTLLWDDWLRIWNNRKRRSNIAIFYDRDCGFCLKLCLIFRELALPKTIPISPAQEDLDAGPILARENSWVVRAHNGKYLTHWRAVAYLWRRSPLLFPLGYLFALPVFAQIGHVLYLLIAKYRKKLADMTAPLLPWDEKPLYYPWRLTSTVLAVLLISVFLLNLKNVTKWNIYWPPALDNAFKVLALSQRWNMYAPIPKGSSTWLVMEGRLMKNDVVDVMHLSLEKPSHAKPHNGWEQFPHFRWRKFFGRVDWKKHGDRIADYYCESWRKTYPDLILREIKITRYYQRTTPPGKPPEKVRKRDSFQRDCYPSSKPAKPLKPEKPKKPKPKPGACKTSCKVPVKKI